MEKISVIKSDRTGRYLTNKLDFSEKLTDAKEFTYDKAIAYLDISIISCIGNIVNKSDEEIANFDKRAKETNFKLPAMQDSGEQDLVSDLPNPDDFSLPHWELEDKCERERH